MKAATKLNAKGQVVIPKAVRERLRWRAGAELDVEIASDGSVRLAPAADTVAELIDRLAGSLSSGDPVGELEADHRAEIAADFRPRVTRRVRARA